MQTIDDEAGPSNAMGEASDEVAEPELWNRYISQNFPVEAVADITVGEHRKVEGTVSNKSPQTAGKSDKGVFVFFLRFRRRKRSAKSFCVWQIRRQN